MLRVLASAALAGLLAAAPQGTDPADAGGMCRVPGSELAMLAPSHDVLEDAVAQGGMPPVLEEKDIPPWARGKALHSVPNAPVTVDLHTRYFGTVTVTHAKHLERHISCKKCHGTGPVGELHPMEPKLAHDRCRGCHVEQKRGPTDCRACHSLPAAAPETPVQGPPAEEGGPVAASSPAGAVAAPVAQRRGLAMQTPDEYRQTETEIDLVGAHSPVFRRVLEFGIAAGDGVGPSVQVTSKQRGIAMALGADRLVSTDRTRTTALAGAGITRAFGNRLDLSALALAGCDIVERPSVGVVPALGLRLGVEFTPRGWGPVQTLHLALTGRVDLMHASTPTGTVGGSEVFATFATGLALPH